MSTEHYMDTWRFLEGNFARKKKFQVRAKKIIFMGLETLRLVAQNTKSAPLSQPRSQGLRGETVTKTLVKFVLSFQNFGGKIACAVRHNRIAITVEYGCVSLRMRFFSQNFGTIKRILPGSSSPSHREGPGTEVASFHVWGKKACFPCIV